MPKGDVLWNEIARTRLSYISVLHGEATLEIISKLLNIRTEARRQVNKYSSMDHET